MAGPTHSFEAWVVGKKPPTDSFQALTLYSVEFGATLALHRLSRKTGGAATLDLFDQAGILAEDSGGAGGAWFIKEARVSARLSAIGKSYESLQFACRLAGLAARNPVSEESRSAVYQLLTQAFTAFATAQRPDVVYFKALYRFCRDEGYPLKQAWLPTLTASDQGIVVALLNLPVAEQTETERTVDRLQRRLDEFLRGHTEILLE